MNSRLTTEEREALYAKKEVPLEGKQRKLQFVNKVWMDPNDMKHVEEKRTNSGKVCGLCEGGGNITKEMFELNCVIPPSKKPWLLGWSPISNLLHL
ncbi:Kinesin-like protein NACK1 [Acorus calamus]|uniref:Kinesin-like protein NACK1 n=1 Tax=Acorus calamus TaxID=4465 RepID=A0AAV9FJQ1_ACOCL|nr:Kinesin-like protein NACK1 [Acorus calamus]